MESSESVGHRPLTGDVLFFFILSNKRTKRSCLWEASKTCPQLSPLPEKNLPPASSSPGAEKLPDKSAHKPLMNLSLGPVPTSCPRLLQDLPPLPPLLACASPSIDQQGLSHGELVWEWTDQSAFRAAACVSAFCLTGWAGYYCIGGALLPLSRQRAVT